MKHHISYFHNALTEYYLLHQLWRKTSNTEEQIDSHKYVS